MNPTSTSPSSSLSPSQQPPHQEEEHPNGAPDPETSAESAALARGASRTAAASTARHYRASSSLGTTAKSSAATASRGAMAGRLPLSSASASSKTAASKAVATGPSARVVTSRGPIRIPKPRNAPSTSATSASSRMSRAKLPGGRGPRVRQRASASSQRLAKASDRASKSLDVLSAGQEWQSEVPSRETNYASSGEAKSDGLNQQSNGNSKIHKHSSSDELKPEKGPWKLAIPSFPQTVLFGKIFVTNTVLGMAVFATYEGIIDYLASNASKNHIPDNNIGSGTEVGNNYAINMSLSTTATMSTEDNVSSCSDSDMHAHAKQWHLDNFHRTKEEGKDDDAMDRASIMQHFFAGGLGGMAHALLSMALEMKLNLNATTTTTISTTPAASTSAKHDWKNANHRVFTMKAPNVVQVLPTNSLNTKPLQTISLQYPTLPYTSSSILHHSLAHSMLFGSYQFTKRFLFQRCHNFQTFDNGENDTYETFNNRDNTITHASIIALAGGLAGQVQHITSHFTERWLKLGEANNSITSVDDSNNKRTVYQRLALSASWPSWRSTMMAFPPSAIGFLAFEYGKFMLSDND